MEPNPTRKRRFKLVANDAISR